MGEKAQNRPNTRYYNILNGQIVRNANEGDAGAEVRVVRNPKTGIEKERWVIPVYALEGKVKSIEIKEVEFDGVKLKKLVLRLIENGEIMQIETNSDSSHAISLINRLANYAKKDLGSIPIVLGSYKIQDANSERYNQGFWIHYGDGTKLENFYVKENTPQDIKWKEITVNNKKVWDKTDYLRFFEKVLEGEVIPYFSKLVISDKVVVDEDTPMNPEDIF